MKKSKPKFGTGKVEKLWPFLVALHEKDPQVFRDPVLLKQAVSSVWTQLREPSRCPNCAASMATYRRRVDYFIVLLVVSMGRIVQEEIKKGLEFTKANMVHVNADERIPHNARNMTGIASALGLIAPVEKLEAHWAITSRGWEALAGKPIPAAVITFRDQIIERPEGTTTFAEVVAGRNSYEERGAYDPNEWVHIEGLQTGVLL